jgi:hypothetical protein
MPIFICKNCGKEFPRKNDKYNPPKFCNRDCVGNGYGHGDGAGRGKYQKHIVIPDTQCKKGVPLEHLRWAGKYIAKQKPDKLILIGDWWDMPSLSSYDVGKKCFEGRRYVDDIFAGNEGLDLLMEGVNTMERQPGKFFFEGNHEYRIHRAVETDPKAEGLITYDDFNLKKHGFEIIPFLKVKNIDGVDYCHYFYEPNSGRPYAGMMETRLKNVGASFTMGHQQGLKFARRELSNGKTVIGLVAGSFYQHQEDYKGPQGNAHWQGIVVKHEVRDGNYDPMFVSLDYLKRTYGKAEGKPLRK